MPKSAIVQARIQPELKAEGEAILKSMGLNTTTAITLFFTQLVNTRSFPLELKIPNEETLEAMREIRDPSFRKNAPKYKNVKELFSALDS